MAGNNLNRQTDLALFSQYHSGEMSLRDQHAFERKLMEDPFLAEAYEGFVKTMDDDSEHLSISATLDQKLERRLEKNRQRRLPVWVYAAAACLLLAIGLYNFNTRRTDNEKLVLHEQSHPARSESTAKRQMEPVVSESRKNNSALKERSEPRQDLASNEPAVKVDSLSVFPKELPFRKEELVADEDHTGIAREQVLAVPASPAPPRLSASKMMSGSSRKNVTYSNVVQGRVTDKLGNGLPGIVIFKYRNPIAATDSNGNFRVMLPGNDSLKITGLGYTEKWILATKPDLGSIVLQENVTALNEVVVVGYGTEMKRSTPSAAAVSRKAAPVDGWDKYRLYLKNSAADYKFTGKIRVRFRVISDGTVTEIKATEPGAMGEAATEIVKNGPKWIPAISGGVKVAEMVELTIEFEN